MDSNEELGRAQEAIAAVGCDAALLSSLANVTYVSGFEVPLPVGAGAETAYGVPLALFAARDNASTLIVSNASSPGAAAQSRLGELRVFDTFDSFVPADSYASYMQRIREALHQLGIENSTATLGIEFRTTPHAISQLFADEFPKLRLRNVDGTLQQARLIKTTREIGLLRRAAAIGDIGHNALAELVREAGRDEFAIWAELTGRMFRAVGHDIPVTGELVTGPRTSVVAYPNGPRNRVTEVGDAALMDISQRVDGYWSDCTNTHVVGGVSPTVLQRRYARAAQDACEAAMAALHPGARASAVWAAAEATFQSYGLTSAHYAGHQIGVAVNELPRLVPYDHTLIQAGMVFAVEPGAYTGADGSFGARAEKVVLVGEAGPEVLSCFAWGV